MNRFSRNIGRIVDLFLVKPVFKEVIIFYKYLQLTSNFFKFICSMFGIWTTPEIHSIFQNHKNIETNIY